MSSPLLNIAVRAARAAGRIILRHVDRVDMLEVTSKGHNDFVSQVDHQAERAIIDTVRHVYPGHGILGEESGSHEGDEYLWIIDPLDGTTNYLHGFPLFAVSVAVQRRGVLEAAVVYDPLHEEMFTATRGGGAVLNQKRIRVSGRRRLQDALIGTGFPFRDMSQLDEYLGTFKKLIPETAGIRRAGSAALDLAFVAAGRLDGFWEFGLKPWDMAAGILLIREAGGLVSDTAGGETFMESGDLVCGNPKIFAAILKEIGPQLSTK